MGSGPGPSTPPAPAHRGPRAAPGTAEEAVRSHMPWTLTSQGCPPTLQRGRRRPRHGRRVPGGVGTSFPVSRTRRLSLGMGMLRNINKAEEGPEPKAPKAWPLPAAGAASFGPSPDPQPGPRPGLAPLPSPWRGHPSLVPSGERAQGITPPSGPYYFLHSVKHQPRAAA